MYRILTTLALTLTLLVPLAAVSPWTPIAERLSPSVVFLETIDEGGEREGACSGFVIDTVKKHVLTVAHCDDAETILVNDTKGVILFKDIRKDLMVLGVANLEKLPAIALATHDPQVGDEIMSIGFGYGLDKPMVRVSMVSITNLNIKGRSGPFFVFDAGFILGQSGGPILDSEGKLISIVQQGDAGSGIGVNIKVIRDRVGSYFQSSQ